MVKVYNKKHAGRSMAFSFGVVEIGEDGLVPIENEDFARTLADLEHFEVIEENDSTVETSSTEGVIEQATVAEGSPGELEQVTTVAESPSPVPSAGKASKAQKKRTAVK